jgi:D-alanyl-D-alanine carboxypeptidase
MSAFAFRGKFAAAIATALGAMIALLAPLEAIANPVILVDVKSGKVLEHQDAFQKWYPASLTKMMTAYVTFRLLKSGRVSLSSPVVMSKASAGQPASKMYLKPGDSMNLDDALKIMITKSANDIAYAIAENVGGSIPDFVGMMNMEAARIGMSSSHFINPNGLPGPGQYTTARDLALLAVSIRREFPEYAHYFALEGIDTGKKQFGNYNLLIGRFDGADGMKTGFICSSGFNQVASATRGGRTVISVVLGSDSLAGRADMSADLLQKGLTTGSLGFTTLASLKPYGETRDQVADISKEICSAKGKKVRSETKDEGGRNKMTSQFIHELDHPIATEIVTITPAGKNKPAATATAQLVDEGDTANASAIPIPQPRPLN